MIDCKERELRMKTHVESEKATELNEGACLLMFCIVALLFD